jgi:hypothetical protein
MPRGITSKLYFNQGVYDPATWILVDIVSDLTNNADWNEGEGSTRREVQQVFEPTNMNLTITGKMRKEIDDVAYLAFRGAHATRGVLDIMILDGLRTVNGSDGFRYDVKVFGWTEDQGLGVVNFRDFTLKPCISTHGVYSVLVAGGVPTFTQLTNNS